MRDRLLLLKRSLEKVISKNIIMFYFLIGLCVVIGILTLFIDFGYVLTVLTVVAFFFFTSTKPKEEDVLLFDHNEKRREIFMELKELNKILKAEPYNQVALERFYEIQEMLNKK